MAQKLWRDHTAKHPLPDRRFAFASAAEAVQALLEGYFLLAHPQPLLRNALDRQAHSITIQLVQDGYDAIVIKDDGIGGRDDELAWLKQVYISGHRHHHTAESTTLARTAWVTRLYQLCRQCLRVMIITRSPGKDHAQLIVLDTEGQIIEACNTPGPLGTTIIARQFLDDPDTSSGNQMQPETGASAVLETVKSYALIRPEVQLTFQHTATSDSDTQQEWKIPAAAQATAMQERVAACYNTNLLDQLQQVHWREGGVAVHALLPRLGAEAPWHASQPQIYINSFPLRNGVLAVAIKYAIESHCASLAPVPASMDCEPALPSKPIPFMVLQIKLTEDTASIDNMAPQAATAVVDAVQHMLEHMYAQEDSVLLGDAFNTQPTDPSTSSLQTPSPTKPPPANTLQQCPLTPVSPIRLNSQSSTIESAVDDIAKVSSPTHGSDRAAQPIDPPKHAPLSPPAALLWQQPIQGSPWYTRDTTQEIAVDWPAIEALYTDDDNILEDAAQTASSPDVPYLIGHDEHIWYGVTADGIVAVRPPPAAAANVTSVSAASPSELERLLATAVIPADQPLPTPITLSASVIGGRKAYQRLQTLASHPVSGDERKIADIRVTANGFDVRVHIAAGFPPPLMLHAVSSQIPRYGVEDLRELASLLVRQNEAAADGRPLFPGQAKQNTLLFCRPARIQAYLQQQVQPASLGNTTQSDEASTALAALIRGSSVLLARRCTT